jgi:hypothetical protein
MVLPTNNPIRFQTDQKGYSLKAISTSTTITTHSFYAVFEIPSNTSSGSASSLSYSTFEVDQKSSSCTAVRWDPYGFVFDAEMLIPLKGIEITLEYTDGNVVQLSGVPNPVFTDNKGFYSFYVPPGIYRMKIKDNDEFEFSSDIRLNPAYVKSYQNLYAPDSLIIETLGSPQRIDIPMKKK